jgi:hypothetical protein
MLWGNINDVIKHKKTYYRSAWSQYESAVPGILKIVPLPTLKENLVKDYKLMAGLLFGEIPEFQSKVNKINE